MTTSVARAEHAAAVTKRAERRFFSVYALGIAGLIFFGFAPSFYLRGMVEPRTPLASLRFDVIAHGLIATMFVAALPLQAWLIAAHKRQLHVIVGKWVFVLGAVVLLSLYVVTAFSHHQFPTGIPGVTPAMASAPSLFAVASFGALLWLAWRWRFDTQAHKRFIIATACLSSGPAIARMPGVPPPPGSFLIVDATLIAMLLPLLIWDGCTLRKLHWATLTGLGVLTGMLAATATVGAMPVMTGFVNLLPGFGWP